MERKGTEEGGGRGSEDVAAELARVEVAFESLRDTSPSKRVAHVFLVALLAVFGTAVSIAALGAVLSVLALASGPLALVMLVSVPLLFVLNVLFFNRHLFVPREDAIQDHQTLYDERRELRDELERTIAREEDAARTLANAQRANHGGNLSIASPATDGGLEVAVATGGSLSQHEEVVLDLDDSSTARTVDAVREVEEV